MSATEYYSHTTYPATGAAGSSASLRSELELVEAGFGKLPDLSGNSSKIVAVNSGGTALEAVTGLTVAQGGTGRVTSTTAYALLAAGTTATGAHQTLAAGATTEILVGGGASALPVWTTATGTGAPVRADSPTLITPALGTPSALVGTNITGTAASLTAGNVTTNANLTGHVTSSGNAAVLGSFTFAQLNTAVSDADVGYLNVPQNSQSAAYTTVLGDAGKHILHPSADTTARTFTIDSNANVAYPVGTAITFVNQVSGGVVTIAITSDTMRLAGAGTTGSRTLAANGIATALKVTTTEWIISGTGLT